MRPALTNKSVSDALVNSYFTPFLFNNADLRNTERGKEIAQVV
jgi:hypothetical protein